jgi:hypothetical protein
MDTGKLAIQGYSAGAIKYVLLDGFVPHPITPGTAAGGVFTSPVISAVRVTT